MQIGENMLVNSYDLSMAISSVFASSSRFIILIDIREINPIN